MASSSRCGPHPRRLRRYSAGSCPARPRVADVYASTVGPPRRLVVLATLVEGHRPAMVQGDPQGNPMRLTPVKVVNVGRTFCGCHANTSLL